VGPGVTEWSRGDRVVSAGSSVGRTHPGACADYLAVPSVDLHPIPENVSFIGAVSIIGTFAAAWSALFYHGQLGVQERVVVVGAADPLGIAAVQICRWKECRVIAVADGRHAPRLGALGTTRVVSQSAPDLAGHVIAGLNAEPATIVVNVTGALLPDSLRMLGSNGRLIILNGSDTPPLDLQLLVSQQIRVIGSSAPVDAVDVHHILKLLSEGTFIPVIDSIFVFTQAAQAHRRAESPDTFGAVLLIPDHLHESAEKITKFDEEG
jgi:NADPH:quinone reductase-like Zn-dependent oxidoreductase